MLVSHTLFFILDKVQVQNCKFCTIKYNVDFKETSELKTR